MNKVKEVKAAFSYNAARGTFIWKKHRCKCFVGKQAGCFNKAGYWLLSLNNTKIMAHRVAWAVYYGVWPTFEIDHKNLNKNDNRISNLRRSNKSNNGGNRPAQKNNSSGFKGVFWHKGAEKWMVQIRVRGTLRYGGLFNSKKDAAKHYDALAQAGFGDHARFNLRAA